MKRFLESIWDILACPYCHSSLLKMKVGARCSNCDERFGYSKSGQLDLRLRKTKHCQLDFELGKNLPECSNLQQEPSSAVDFSGIKPPRHLDREMLQHFPAAQARNSLVLDLGCGGAIHRKVCEHAGFRYVGLDISSSSKATMLGDAHALPFKNGSFELVLSIAVFEHIQYPFVAMNEIYRVLEPHGELFGSVAFLEPLHDHSFYHHTYLGTANSLQFAGFSIEHLAPSNNSWSGLRALATMGLFPKLPRQIAKLLVLPIHLLHRTYWKMGYLVTHSHLASERYRLLATSGAFFFIASKPYIGDSFEREIQGYVANVPQSPVASHDAE